MIACRSSQEYVDKFSSFKFFVRFLENVDHDETFQEILLETTKAVRDENKHLPFKEVLNEVLERNKSLIIARAREEKDGESEDGDAAGVNVWHLILQEVEEENHHHELLKIFETYILYYRNLQRDKTFQAVRRTVEFGREAGMKFEDSLNFAVQENKSRIYRALAKATSEAARLGKEWTRRTVVPHLQHELLYT